MVQRLKTKSRTWLKTKREASSISREGLLASIWQRNRGRCWARSNASSTTIFHLFSSKTCFWLNKLKTSLTLECLALQQTLSMSTSGTILKYGSSNSLSRKLNLNLQASGCQRMKSKRILWKSELAVRLKRLSLWWDSHRLMIWLLLGT